MRIASKTKLSADTIRSSSRGRAPAMPGTSTRAKSWAATPIAIARQTRHGSQAEGSAPQALKFCAGPTGVLPPRPRRSLTVGALNPSQGTKLRTNMRIPVAMIMKSVRLTSRRVPDCMDDVDNFPPLARFGVIRVRVQKFLKDPAVEPHEEKA